MKELRIPSLAVFSAVVGKDIKKIGNGNDTNIAHWGVDNRYYATINKYEFLHLMQQWLLNLKKIDSLDIYHEGTDHVTVELVGECAESGEGGCVLYYTHSETEYDALLQMCEWAIKELKCTTNNT